MLSHKRDHYCGLLTEEMAGQKVHLSGWVQRTRDLGGVVFVWLRDREGLVQLVFDNSVCSQEIFDLGRSLRSEYVVTVLGTVKKEEYNEAVTGLQKLPEKMEQFLASESCEAIPKYASQYFNHNSVFFIGRNLDYALGLEGSLKLKEISYIHSEAYAAGELKHGTISLIEDGTLVIALGTYAPLFDKAMSNVVEVKARGADVLALATESHRGEMAKTVENVITIPDTAQMLLPSLGVVPLQLLAYYIALQRGCDIDKPRNLAKSVTVE